MTHQELEDIAALDAIGAATEEESRALDEHLESCESCRRARDEYAEAATLLARGLAPVPPPNDIRERVVNAVDDDEVAEGIDARHRFGAKWWLASAAMLFLALWGWRELGVRAQREHLVSQDAELRRLNEENAVLAERNEKLNSEMAALASRETRTIALTGQQVSPSASARVFLEPSQRKAVVFFYNLPVNPTNKSYQLWIIRSDQPKPESAGVFDAGANGSATITVQNLPVSTEIKALAVTLEPRGGVDQPTNTNFYVMGGSS
jgi:hypothetical protein